jgi:hypothetical protein
VGHHLGLAGAGGEPTERIIMQEYTPKKSCESGRVNIPRPMEPRWAVAVLDCGSWENLVRGYGPEAELVRILDPKTGEAASRYDAGTWADFDRAKNACGTARFQKDGGVDVGYKNRPVFVDSESRLRFPNGRLVLESSEAS